MEYLVTMVMLLSFIFPQQLVVSQTNYHHMEFVLQWPPTFCWTTKNCINPIPLKFTLHGLWPANSSGSTLTCAPPKYNTVVWGGDRKLAADLHTCWSSLIRGLPDFVLWQHEWRKHGYCSSQTINDVEYFKGAVRIFQTDEMIKGNTIYKKLDSHGYVSNDHGYSVTAIKNLISKEDIYISCKANATHAFLHEIYFCFDPMLLNIIDCPPNQDTRGCGVGNKRSNIIIPEAI